jgi:hypothetical protein
MPARLTSSTWTLPSSSAAWKPESQPFRFPIGERTASTITDWAMAGPPLGAFVPTSADRSDQAVTSTTL